MPDTGSFTSTCGGNAGPSTRSGSIGSTNSMLPNIPSPTVTIIIPFFNHIAYMAPAVEGVYSQTYGDWELILVDNNSSDGSAEAAAAISASSQGKVVYTKALTQGIPFARNRGIACARGRYICFLDIDDQMVRTKIADQVQILEAYPEAAMVYGLTRRVYKTSEKQLIQPSGAAKEGINHPPALAIDWMRCLYHIPQTGSELTRLEIVKKVNGFEERLQLGNDDAAFYLKIAFGHNIYFLKKEAVIYFRHSRSAGAALDRTKGVNYRYYDTYRWAIGYSREYWYRTSKCFPYLVAERCLIGSLVDLTANLTIREGGEVLRREVKQLEAAGHLCQIVPKVFLLYVLPIIPPRLRKLCLRIYWFLMARVTRLHEAGITFDNRRGKSHSE